MKRTDTPKKAYQLKNGDQVIDLTGLPIYAEVRFDTPANTVVKKFKTATWPEDVVADDLPIDDVNNAFIVYLTPADVDKATCGKYEIDVWFNEEDADLPDGIRRRFVQITDEISISDD